MKITKKQQEAFLRSQLSTNPTWASKALIRIFENQTEDEQNVEATVVHNGIGFTGTDANILTSFAKQYIRQGWLSQKQYVILFKKMGKYWRQILAVSDTEKLNRLIEQNLR